MEPVEILPPEPAADARLPQPYLRRLQREAERTRYVARPGIRALPSGSLTVLAFAGLQAWTLTILLWAIWWPQPRSFGDWEFSVSCTAVLLALVVGVILLLVRKFPGFLLGVVCAPFIRLTVTDRRLVWSLPWHRAPLMEIGRERILDGLLGPVDHRGHGSAAVVLVPGDPSADIDGNIHFDRLPHAAAFVAAIRAW